MTCSRTRCGCTTGPGSRSCSCSGLAWWARSRTSARSPRSGGSSPSGLAGSRPGRRCARWRCVSVAGIAVIGATTSPSSWARDFTQQPANAATASGPARLTTISSTSRWQWWQEAWQAFEDQPLRGTGAAIFDLTHRLLRTNAVVATEPHDLPLQLLSETGIVGALLAAGSLAAAGIGIVAARSEARRGGAAGRARARARGARLRPARARRLRLGLRRRLRAVPGLGRGLARQWGSSRAGAALGARAASGRAGARGCVLAPHPLVRAAVDRLGARVARRRAPGAGGPAGARRALAQSACAWSRCSSRRPPRSSSATSARRATSTSRRSTCSR